MLDSNKAGQNLTSYLMYILLFIVLAIVAYTRIRLLNVPLERDEGEYAYMGQLLLKGIPPYLNVYTMKLPGVSAVYALFMLFLGQTPFGIHLGLLVVNVLCIYFIYLLTAKLFERDTAIISCSTYALLSVSQSVLGVFAHATHFVVLFTLPALILLLYYLDNKKSIYVFSSGLCFGLAFIMKQHAMILIVFAALYLAWRYLRGRTFNRKEIYIGSTLLTIGIGLPFLFITCSIFITGGFDEFWFWTVQYASEYSAGVTISNGITIFIDQIKNSTRPLLPIWLLAATGFTFLFLRRTDRSDKIFIGGFFLFSFLSICPGFYFREHYFVLLLPVISILAGYGSTSIVTLLPKPLLTPKIQPLTLLVILIPAFAYGMIYEKEYLFNQSLYQVSRSTYGTNPFPEALVIASYLKSHTTENDKVAILGSEPEILFYANRLSATGHIYMYGLMENQPFAEQMQNQAIKQITEAEPKYVVLVNIPTSWLRQPESKDNILNWANDYLINNYQLAGIVDMLGPYEIKYIWDESVMGYTIASDYFVKIYQRKTVHN